MSGPNSGQIWINGKVYDFLDVLQNDQMFPPSRSPTGSARVYFDQSTQKLMLSENGGAYAPIAAGSQTPWTSNINGGGYTLTNVKWSRCIQMTANLSNAKSDSNYIKLIDEPSCPLFPNGIKVTGVQVTCFNKTSGMTDVLRNEFSSNPNRYIGSVITIEGMERLKSGAIRHPRFVAIRTDKNPNQCRWYQGEQ